MHARLRASALAFAALLVLAPAVSAAMPTWWNLNAYGPVDADLPPGGPWNKAGDATFYPYYPVLVLELNRLADAHPDRVKLQSAGKSVLGLDLWYLEIADFGNPDMIPLDEREVVYIDGATHSNEYSAAYFVTEIAQFLLDEYDSNETAKWIVDNRHTFILPMVNPDGSNAFGRINANGVNINRNFPATWGAVNEVPVVNDPGPYPGSEPETQAVMRMMDDVRPDYVNSIHCCGNLWLHPYGAEQIPLAVDTEMYTRICDEVFADIRNRCGPIWSTIYPASGTTADEGYVRAGASSWTYEMSGRGRIAGPWAEPMTREDVRHQERESWAGIMHAFLNVHKYGGHPKLVSLAGDAERLTVILENVGYGNLTEATLTVDGVEKALPDLRPDERITVVFEGAYAEGDLAVKLEWRKRLHENSTHGLRNVPVTLVAAGNGLFGAIGGTEIMTTAAPADDEDARAVPPASVLAALAAIGAVAILRRRRG